MIDWNRVQALRLEIGADDFAEVVALFLEEADEAVARLQPGAGPRALEADLHFLKGSALNLGFADFAALCQGAERAAAGPALPTETAAAGIAAIIRCYAASKTAFEAGLDGLPMRRAG